ncbi:MAG: hypothetical protein ACTHPS_00240, partial [Streptosporangiaceae bacterium]
MASAAGSAARRQPSGQGRRASAQQTPGRSGSDEVSRSRVDVPVALVDPNPAADAAAAESSPARGKRVRSRGGSAPEAAGDTPGGSGRKGRKAASRDAGGSEASEAGTEGAARALREAPAVNSGDPTDGSGADGAADPDAGDLEDVVGLEDVA